MLEFKLQQTGFALLFWAGDGGLFVRQFNGTALELEEAATAGTVCFQQFKKWNKRQKGKLRLRVLATYLPKIIVYQDAGHWFSPRLNALLKYERDLGFEDAFIVTDDLRCELNPQGKFYHLLVNPRRISLPHGESITVWMHKRYPIKLKESSKRFSSWVRTLSASFGENLPSRLDLRTVGNSTLLDSPLEDSGYRAIEVEYVTGVESSVSTSARDIWANEEDQLVANNVTGTKLAIVQFKGQLLDEPVCRLTCRSIRFEEARAFHLALIRSPDLLSDNEANARDVTLSGTTLPNILCAHVIVVMKGSDGGNDLLLAHRRKGERKGGYAANRWSVSIEENFLAEDQKREKKVIPRDRSIKDTVLRGVKEEIVGDNFAGQINVAVHGFFLERLLLNFSFLAVAELPDTTFDDVCKLWPDADDYSEHDALGSLPLGVELLTKCLTSQLLPGDVREHMKFTGAERFTDEDHCWHPTSAIRIALALWSISLHGSP